MSAFGLPKGTPEEQAARAEAIEAATLRAAQVPMETIKTALAAFPVLKAVAEKGNPASASDAGVGALAARAAVRGAMLNVKINAAGLNDKAVAAKLIAEAEGYAGQARAAEEEILAIIKL